MRQLLVLLTASLLLVACEKKDNTAANESATDLSQAQAKETANNTASTLPITTIQFAEESHKFGKVSEGQKVAHTFKFKNTGQSPLQITGVKPSCGCTTPSWSKNAIQPGEEGFIEVQFDSKGRLGTNKKSVEVFANTDPKVHVLAFEVEVDR